MPRTEVWAGARRKAAPGKAAFRRPSRRSIKVWICRYERAPLTIARIENRITPACPYIFPSARRRSGMAARQVRRSVVMSNLRVGLLAMDSDRLPLRKRKDVLHGAAHAVPLRQSVEQPCGLPGGISVSVGAQPVGTTRSRGDGPGELWSVLVNFDLLGILGWPVFGSVKLETTAR